jgi:ABC-type antimicrobial peptide transport system permease subunit
VIGLHGVLSFVVVRRTREIGIRMALGAEQGGVVRLVMREMLLVILIGVAAGLAVAAATGSYVESQLFGVKAADVPVFAGSAVVMLVAALGAAFLPAWRASRIDPMRALRYE